MYLFRTREILLVDYGWLHEPGLTGGLSSLNCSFCNRDSLRCLKMVGQRRVTMFQPFYLEMSACDCTWPSVVNHAFSVTVHRVLCQVLPDGG